jgi:hypothetical protein
MTFTPAAVYQGRWGAMGSAVHLVSGTKVSGWSLASRTLCGKRAAKALPGTAEDATCAVCRLQAGVSRRRR